MTNWFWKLFVLETIRDLWISFVWIFRSSSPTLPRSSFKKCHKIIFCQTHPISPPWWSTAIHTHKYPTVLPSPPPPPSSPPWPLLWSSPSLSIVGGALGVSGKRGRVGKGRRSCSALGTTTILTVTAVHTTIQVVTAVRPTLFLESSNWWSND